MWALARSLWHSIKDELRVENGSNWKYRDYSRNDYELEVRAYEILKWVAERRDKHCFKALFFSLKMIRDEKEIKIVSGKCHIQKSVFFPFSFESWHVVADLNVTFALKFPANMSDYTAGWLIFRKCTRRIPMVTGSCCWTHSDPSRWWEGQQMKVTFLASWTRTAT